jgi:hypothetical protein
VKPPVAWLYLRCSPMMNSVSVLLSGISRSLVSGYAAAGRSAAACNCRSFSSARNGPPALLAHPRPAARRVAQPLQQQIRPAEILPRAPLRRRDDGIQSGRLGRFQAVDRVLESDAGFGRQAQHAECPDIDIRRGFLVGNDVTAGERLEPVPGFGAAARRSAPTRWSWSRRAQPPSRARLPISRATPTQRRAAVGDQFAVDASWSRGSVAPVP